MSFIKCILMAYIQIFIILNIAQEIDYRQNTNDNNKCTQLIGNEWRCSKSE